MLSCCRQMRERESERGIEGYCVSYIKRKTTLYTSFPSTQTGQSLRWKLIPRKQNSRKDDYIAPVLTPKWLEKKLKPLWKKKIYTAFSQVKISMFHISRSRWTTLTTREMYIFPVYYKVNEFLPQVAIRREDSCRLTFAQVMTYSLVPWSYNGLRDESIFKLHDKSSTIYRNLRSNKSVYFFWYTEDISPSFSFSNAAARKNLIAFCRPMQKTVTLRAALSRIALHCNIFYTTCMRSRWCLRSVQ